MEFKCLQEMYQHFPEVFRFPFEHAIPPRPSLPPAPWFPLLSPDDRSGWSCTRTKRQQKSQPQRMARCCHSCVYHQKWLCGNLSGLRILLQSVSFPCLNFLLGFQEFKIQFPSVMTWSFDFVGTLKQFVPNLRKKLEKPFRVSKYKDFSVLSGNDRTLISYARTNQI